MTFSHFGLRSPIAERALELVYHQAVAVNVEPLRAQRAGVALPDDVIEQVTTMIDSAPGAATASMQRDIMQGKPSELSAQNGAVVRLGRSFNVETPINAFICAALSPLERRARGELTFD